MFARAPILYFLLLASPVFASEPAWHPAEVTTRSYLPYDAKFHMPPTALGVAAEKEPVAAAALAHFRGNEGPKALEKWRQRYASSELYLTSTLHLASDFQVVRVTGIDRQTARSVGREWLPLQRNPEGIWNIGAFPLNRPFAVLLASPPRRGGEITTERSGHRTTRPKAGGWMSGMSGDGWKLSPKVFPPTRSQLPQPEPAEASLCVVETSQIYVSATGFTLEIDAGVSIQQEDAAPACGEEVAGILASLTLEAVSQQTTLEVSPLLRCGAYLACRYRAGTAGDWSRIFLERNKHGAWVPAADAFLPPVVRAWSGSNRGMLHWDAVRQVAIAGPPKIQKKGLRK